MEIAFKLLISLLIGAAIGLEREIHEKHHYEEKKNPNKGAILGIRTLALTTALGTFAGLLYVDHFSIFIALTVIFGALLITHYFIDSSLTEDVGFTTEIAIVYCYLIGLAIGIELFPLSLVLATTVVLMLILSNKENIKSLVDHMRRRELQAFISYAMISLVILPSLPNTTFTLSDIPYAREIISAVGISYQNWASLDLINPFTSWLVVAIFTGVDVLGYVLKKTIGQGKGLIISSLVGGFVSSTATTQALAAQSKKSKSIHTLLAAALLATFASFFSLILVVFPLNPLFILRIFPTLAILILGFGISSFLFFRLNKDSNKDTIQNADESSKIFSLHPALIFALMYLSIKIISKIALQLFGQSGFLAAAALAGFTGIDAMSINIAQLYGNTIDTTTAILAFIIVNAVNLIAKTIYIYFQGSKEFTWKFGATVGVIILLSFTGLFFV